MIDCKRDMSSAIVAIGSNLSGAGGEPPIMACERAVGVLASLEEMRVLVVSRWYRTAAIPAGSGPDYVNGCVRIATGLDPAKLLARLQEIEATFGRVRSARDVPRTLDLDIVAVDDVVRAVPDPILPHPRAHLRAFVLRPLADIWPGWRHPVSGETVEALLAALPPQQIDVLPSARSGPP